MADKYRVGLIFHGVGRKIPVDGIRGAFTTHDNQIGQQVYWFASIAEFEAKKKAIYLQRYVLGAPVPVVQLLEQPPDPTAIVQLILEGKLVFSAGQEQQIIDSIRTKRAASEPPPPPLSMAEIAPDLPDNPSPDAPAVASTALADFIFTQHAGRKIRVNDFAKALDIAPEDLKNIVSKDSRYAPMVAGWVTLKRPID